MSTRAEAILAGIDIEKQVGLEIGPLDKAIVKRREGVEIYYADYVNREELRRNSLHDSNVDVDAIPEIDFIISPLPSSLGAKFDYIVASHVGEHVPDLIGWIKTLFGWLNPDGLLVLALPDMRFTFDCYRHPSSVGELIEAYLEQRQRPSIASIYDGFSSAVIVDGWYLWEQVTPPEPFKKIYTKEQALQLAVTAHENSVYRDCHCWVFTADLFKNMMEEVRALHLINFEWASFVFPVKYIGEFYVSFRVKGA